MDEVIRVRISGRGFLGLSQNGVSAHEFDSEPSAVSSSEEEGVVWNDDEPGQNMFIECVDLDTELSLDSNLQRSEPPTPWLRIINVSALIAVVSARSPPHEVRSIQDRDQRAGVLLGSNGEADHHQIDCLRCCGSHDARTRLFGFVEREATRAEIVQACAWSSGYVRGI